ncbi:glycosyltransferase [Fontimonas sp. SYSU GA230001]|uniref:glycosyltransferase family 2 protein n=1 Tax=Fontimonas sp. SYSU GA230001 TaxID=3142450 RepID=UPI0032B399E8
MPAVSVVLPTYNRAASLGRAVRSVLQQSVRDLELIVVDDGSTDDTPRLLAAITDPRLRVVRQHNRGAAAARNAGIALATAEWLAFQDSDDEWLPDKLALQLDAARAAGGDVGLVLAGYRSAHPGMARDIRPRSALHRGDPLPDLLDGWPIITPTWLVRRALVQTLGGFDESLTCFEDWDLVFRLADCTRIAAIPGPVLVKYGSTDSVCGNRVHLRDATAWLLAHHGHRWHGHPWRLARRHAALGCLQYHTGQRDQARASFRTAMRLAPLHPATGLWLASFLHRKAVRAIERLAPHAAGFAP